MRVGVFGGTFDPVHYGHLVLAEYCREQCRLDQVWFLPAAVPPHKQRQSLAPAPDRLEMLNLAIGGHETLTVCTLELDCGGINYTVDSLETLRQEYPNETFFFLMGADSLHEMPTWKNPQRICQLATLAIVQRAGTPEIDFNVLAPFLPEPRLHEIEQYRVEMPLIDLHSTQIRRRIHLGLSIRYQVPRAVEKYVQAQGLYLEED